MHKIVTKLADQVKALRIATNSFGPFISWPDELISSNIAPKLALAEEKVVAWQML
jgi:hypothetical protein